MWHWYAAGDLADVPDDLHAIQMKEQRKHGRDDNRHQSAEVAEPGARQRDGEHKGSNRHGKRPQVDPVEIGQQVDGLSDFIVTSRRLIAGDGRELA